LTATGQEEVEGCFKIIP